MTKELKRILNKLTGVKRLESFHIFLVGFINAVIITLSILLLASLVESIARGDSAFRSVLFLLSILLVIISAAYFLYPFLQRNFSKKHNPDLNSIAKRVGFKYPEMKDKLSNTVQLLSNTDSRQSTSSELAVTAFRNVYDEAADKDFSVIIDRKKTKKTLLFFVISLIIFTSVFLGFSGSLSSALSRIMNYDKEYIPPAPFSLDINPKKKIVTRGEQIRITVESKGKTPDYIELHLREFQQQNFEILNLKPDSTGKFIYFITSAKNSLEFFAQSPWVNTFVKTEMCSLVVVDKPLIKSINGKIVFPSYTNLSTVEFNEQSADITALKGSIVDFSILANKDLSEANLIILPNKNIDDTTQNKKQDTIRIRMNVNGNKANSRFSVNRSGNYYFEVKDKYDRTSSDPVIYNIAMLTDEYPSINLDEPQSNVIINEAALLPLIVSISDDYGFSNLKLFYRLAESRFTDPDTKFSSVSIPVLSGELSVSVPYLWDLNKMNISPEDKYEFYLEVWDNDVVSGPKSAKTKTMTVRLPSLDEVLESADDMQKKIENDARQLLKETEEMKKEMEQMNRDMMQKPKGSQMDWKDKKKAEEVLKKQDELQKKINDLQKNIEDMASKLNENKAISQETLQKYMELQKLLKEVNSPELRKLQEQMEKALQNMSKDQLEQAMKNTKFDEEQFKKSIERTMKILKRLQAEQKTDAIQKRAEELLKKQDELNKETENSNLNNSEKRDQLAKEQNNLQKDLKNIDTDLKDLEKLMKEIGDDMPMQDLNKAMEDLNSSETSGEMENAQQQINQGNQSKAGKSQQKAKSNLSKFSESMKSLKQKMQNNVTNEAIRKMQKSMNDLLELSKEQESLKQQAGNLDYHSSQIPELTDQQMQLLQSLKNVASSMMELSEKSFAFTPQMAQEMGNAMHQMQNSIQQLNNRSTTASGQSQNEAMSSMNKAAAQMQSMLNAMQNKSGQCDNPGGQGQGQAQGQGMSFSQRMQQLAQQQQGINGSMEQMMGSQSKDGKMSPQQQAELGRIAKEQGNAKKAIEELAKEQKQMGGERLSLGDLDKIAQEMKEVMTDMQSGNITPETLQRQERILSRLLDANLSMNERDYEKNRESKSGQQFNRQSPGQLIQDKTDNSQSIEELLRSLQLGYSRDYELLIKKYFESLQNNGKALSK